MNAVRTRGGGNVSAIVDQQTSGTATRNRGRPQRQFIAHPGGQIFFANLNETDAGSNRGFNEFEEARELFSGRCCCVPRLAARDQIGDRRLQVETIRSRHFALDLF